MVANILPVDPPTPGAWSKFTLFQNMVMLHIKLKGMTNAATCMQPHILSLHTPSTPGVGSEVQIVFLTESCHVALHMKLKGTEHNRAPFKHILCPYTHPQPQRADHGGPLAVSISGMPPAGRYSNADWVKSLYQCK